MLAHADTRVVFCENAAQAKKVDEVRQSCPDAPGPMSLDELCAKGHPVDPEAVDERVLA